MISNTKILFFFIILLFLNIKVSAQVDSSYIATFDQDFSVRTYATIKLSGIKKEVEKDKIEEQYRANTPVGIGVGASWKNYSFSFSRRIGLLRDSKKGKTSSTEFQYYGYKRKYAYTLSFQQHKGFYLDKPTKSGSYETYPNMKLNMYSGSFQWVFNNKKFSYKAAFNQTERQIKSAGSLLLGTAIYYNKLDTDTLTLYTDKGNVYENIQWGITGGYTYTWVIDNNWFVTGGGDLGLNLGSDNIHRIFKSKINVYPSFNARIATGYNLDSWSFGFSTYFNQVFLIENKDRSLSTNEFNFQVTVIKRFDWANKFVNKTLNNTKKKLNKFGI